MTAGARRGGCVRRVLGWLGGVLVTLVLAWAVMHVVISPVNPRQEAPRKHYLEAPCWTCHFVLESAVLKELDADE